MKACMQQVRVGHSIPTGVLSHLGSAVRPGGGRKMRGGSSSNQLVTCIFTGKFGSNFRKDAAAAPANSRNTGHFFAGSPGTRQAQGSSSSLGAGGRTFNGMACFLARANVSSRARLFGDPGKAWTVLGGAWKRTAGVAATSSRKFEPDGAGGGGANGAHGSDGGGNSGGGGNDKHLSGDSPLAGTSGARDQVLTSLLGVLGIGSSSVPVKRPRLRSPAGSRRRPASRACGRGRPPARRGRSSSLPEAHADEEEQVDSASEVLDPASVVSSSCKAGNLVGLGP
mmetsp:Transcript_17315/g.35771  ORF Transcript_17315/g.35771 Transcript_17315/m.35771 type:complete len:282 (-) Transcript_17315:226-1071(-)